MSQLRERVTNLSLRWKIGSLVVVGLLAIFVLFGLLGKSIADDAKERTVNGWASIAQSTATVIDSEIDLDYARLEQVAATLGAASPDAATQRRVLDGIAGSNVVGNLVLIAPDRTVVWSMASTAATAAAVADPRILDPLTSGARYASGVVDVNGSGEVVLAVPVRSQGVLASVFAPGDGAISELISSARGLAHTGHAELVDQNDRVIASTDPGEVLGPGEHPDFYDPHLQHHTSGVGLTAPVGPQDPTDQGQRHDMAFVSLSSAPWGFALGGNDAELSADAVRWEGQTIALGVISLFVALFFVWLTTRAVVRPVLALATASRQIAAGDLATPVRVTGEGEVRALGQDFDRMREKLRVALSELAVEKSRYEGIVTSMADAVVTTDTSERITAFNPAAEALTGWPATEALGRPCADVLASADAHEQIDAPSRTKIRRRDGTDVTVSMTHATVTAEGETVGTVHVLRDVSAETEVERMKEEFLATVSHELRTPLGFIMGYATSLLLPDAPDDRETTRRFLGVIAESSKELEDLVDDLMDMTKISSGTLSVAARPAQLAPLVRAALDRARVREPERHFAEAVPSDLPQILADARRVEQVLYDLLDNAIKYSPHGGPISVSAEQAGDTVVVSVVDEGLGVAPDELASIFERFHRGSVARARAISGTGLGLAICKGIVEAHGGRIWAESPATAAGRGTAIRFTVPVAVIRGDGAVYDELVAEALR
ncbi:MAG TPA: ATP-binding protein [Candidatus Acidoferrales bacterium]|nr:ATP-binding protein [Candidatus Acidoferrales bacterium]